MGLFFSRKPKITAHDRAILELKNQRDRLTRYQERVFSMIEKETKMAKDLVKQGKKKQALLALKKKKHLENLQAKSEGQMENIQTMVDSIEFAVMEKKVFDSLKEGNSVLQEIHQEIGGIDAVEALMEETREAIERQEEIENAIAGKITAEDEEYIESEMAKLESEMTGGVIQIDKLPSVPQTKLPTENSPVKQPQKQKQKQKQLENDDDDEIISIKQKPSKVSEENLSDDDDEILQQIEKEAKVKTKVAVAQ